MVIFWATDCREVADSRLMHRSITAGCPKIMLNGGNRPNLDIRCDVRLQIEAHKSSPSA
jgi:hypothetical protein